MPPDPVHVLLVEDHEADRLSFQQMVRSANLSYDLTTVTSVAEATAALGERRPDVVITDYNLSDGTAEDLRRGMDGDTPLVIITGASSQEVAIQAIRQGAFDLLVKDARGDYLRMLPVTIESAVAQAQARRQVRMLSQALMSIGDSVYVIDTDRRILFANNSFRDRYDCGDCAGQCVDEIYEEMAPQYAPGDELGLGAATSEGFVHRTRSGACCHVLKSTSEVLDSNGHPVATVVVIRDISEIVEISEQLRRYATTDELTNTMSRHFGLLLLEKQMAVAARSGKPLTICYVDIDDLKVVNDTYGHQEGDSYITLVTRTLSRPFRVSDSLCRLGGDEFLLVLPDCNLKQAKAIWKRIEGSIAGHNRKSAKPYAVSISHGFVEFDPTRHNTVDQLIADADRPMYAEKARKTAARRSTATRKGQGRANPSSAAPGAKFVATA